MSGSLRMAALLLLCLSALAWADKTYTASQQASGFLQDSMSFVDLSDGGVRGSGFFELRAPDGGRLVPGGGPVLIRVEREAPTHQQLRGVMRDAGCGLVSAVCP